jgi:hypothetical protein
MEQVVIQFSADISKLLPAIEAFEKVGLIDKKNGDIFRTTSAEYSKRNQVLDQTIAKNKELDKTISSGAVEAHTADIKENTKAIEQNTQGSENLIRTLKNMQRELIAMEAAGEQNTQRFKDLERAAGELRDTISDAKERVKTFASDTRRLDTVVQSFKLIAGAAAAMQGAFALFGEESAELQKTMIRLQGALALLAGAHEIAEFATGQSALKLALLDGAQKLATVSAEALGISVTAAMSAMTLGVGAVVGLILAFVDFGDESKVVTDALKKQNEAIDEQRKKTLLLQYQIEDLTIARELELGNITQFAAARKQIELNTNREISEKQKEFNKNRENIAKNALTILLADEEDAADALKKFTLKNGKLVLKTRKDLNDETYLFMERANKAIEKAEKLHEDELAGIRAVGAAKIDIENIKEENARKAAAERTRAELKREAERRAKEELDAFKALKKQREDLSKGITEMPLINELPPVPLEIKAIPPPKAQIDGISAFMKAQIAAATEFGISQEQLMEEYYASGLENFEEFLKKKRKLLEEQAQIEAQLQQTINQVVTEGANAALEIAKANMQAEYDARLDTLEKQKAAILENQNLTESQREATEKVFEDRRKKLMLQKWKAEQQIAISSAVINAALAVGNALATTKPFPAALIAAAGAAVSGAIQVAKIKSAPIPQFAEGTEFLEGAGTGTSDSIPAMLSRGERVVPAKTNKDYFDGLSVIQNRLVAPELVNSLLTNLAENGGMLAAPTEAITQLEQQFGIDYARLGKEFQKGRTQVSINIDEKGFTKHIQQGLNRSTYHNQKFRFKQ